MFGIILAAGGGALLAFADAGKKALTSVFSPEAIILITMTVGIIINLCFFLVTGFPDVVWSEVWLPALLLGGLGAVGELLFLYGLRGTDLSLAIPLNAFLPIMAAGIDYLFFGVSPNTLGSVGVTIIILGSYLMSIKLPVRGNLLTPLQSIFSDKGCQLILLAVFIGAIIFVGQKHGVKHSSPVAFFTLLLAVDWVIFAGLVVVKGARISGTELSRHTKMLALGTGGLWGIGLTMAAAAYSYTLAAYASAALQVQTLLAIAIGAALFGEDSFKQRMGAGLVMVLGVIAVCFSSS